MLESLHLQNVGPAPEIEMELAPRLNLITGDNGLGKSFLLDIAWWALTRRWPQEVNPKMTSGYAARPTDRQKPASIDFRLSAKTKKSVEYTSRFLPRDEAWIGKAGRPWNPGLVLYAHADGGFSVWDPARNYWKKKGSVDVQERLPAYVFAPKDVWDGLEVSVENSKTIVCNGLVRDWASWIREGGVAAKNMATVLALLSPSDEPKDLLYPGPLTRLSVNDARDIPSLKTAYANTVPILHASSGVRRITALAYMLLWSWNEHLQAAKQLGEKPTTQVVLLVDEIESHLHPRWQRSILRALLQLAQVLHRQATIQLIAATHSPLILASAEPTFDATLDAWFDFDLEEQGKKSTVLLRKREFVRHGDVSNWLTSEAFDLKSSRSLEAEKAIGQARALLRRKKPATLQEVRDVDKLLREAVLPDIDPFWVRWNAFIESLQESG
jgi:predicted ATPase